MKIIILSAVILIGSITNVFAQENNHFELELDPLAYAFGGISGHIAYTFKNQRIQLGYAQITVPDAYQSNEKITESFKGFPLVKWDIFFGKDDVSHGFFAGPTMNYVFTKYETETDEAKAEGLNVGIRGGYRFDIFKKSNTLNGLYLTPWVGFSYDLKSNDIELDNQVHSIKPWGIFPTFHLGWAF
ncbi:MAG: hypothetical protein ABJF11_13505 [Reichenbachiella sp.]|uniref:hypothetical protein n=1 Tax=Reichenbachiella sp. TaxID=2184521 RepID=UPI003264D85F